MFEDMPRESIFEKYADEKEDKNSSAYKKNMPHRGTFVGTPLYASPEMLDSSISGPFTDLWALGVIVYQIINGEVPWKGNQEFGIF
jgi:serine/threonine protein kinase